MDTRLSKTLSYFLRHAPEEAGLAMDEQGFVELKPLVGALRERGWDSLTVEQLIARVDAPDVDRFERRGEVLRACYGHSVGVSLDYPPIRPPSPLYHGTSPGAWESIREQGLCPMGRQYVHLSRTRAEARRVGQRHHPDPVLLAIEPPREPDREFYRAGPVVLTDRVPVEWIRRLESDG